MRFLLVFLFSINIVLAQDTSVKIALLKYKGGGDWYANPTALPNLIKFCNKHLGTKIAEEPPTVAVGSNDIFKYPIVDMTGHGNVFFTTQEVRNLRKYLMAGGFLHISDNYGLDPYIRREMKKVFPNNEFIELPFSHPIYHTFFDFKNGLPKIHEHDGKPAQGFGIIYKGRLLVFYDYQCDLGDGWEDPEVHNDPISLHIAALRMGANIVKYVFEN